MPTTATHYQLLQLLHTFIKGVFWAINHSLPSVQVRLRWQIHTNTFWQIFGQFFIFFGKSVIFTILSHLHPKCTGDISTDLVLRG